MKVILLIISVLVLRSESKNGSEDELASEIAKAKHRLQSEFILKLWYGANEAISESQDKILKIYTEYTIQQAQHAIEHISLHQNLTKSESVDKRTEALSTKNLSKLVSSLECLFTNEANTIRSYKLTGYNLHNCIRLAQNEMEGKYLKIVQNLNHIKSTSLQAFDYYLKTIENCVQTSCVMSNLFRSIIEYEKLTDEVSTNVTLVNNISTRYVFTHIAMGCISGSLTQISDNYKTGKDLAEKCLLSANESHPSQNINQKQEFV